MNNLEKAMDSGAGFSRIPFFWTFRKGGEYHWAFLWQDGIRSTFVRLEDQLANRKDIAIEVAGLLQKQVERSLFATIQKDIIKNFPPAQYDSNLTFALLKVEVSGRIAPYALWLHPLQLFDLQHDPAARNVMLYEKDSADPIRLELNGGEMYLFAESRLPNDSPYYTAILASAGGQIKTIKTRSSLEE